MRATMLQALTLFRFGPSLIGQAPEVVLTPSGTGATIQPFTYTPPALAARVPPNNLDLTWKSAGRVRERSS